MSDAGDDCIRLAKIRLGIARRMRERHEHPLEKTAPFPNVILDDRLPTREAMLVAKTLEYPLRLVALLAAVNRLHGGNDLGLAADHPTLGARWREIVDGQWLTCRADYTVWLTWPFRHD